MRSVTIRTFTSHPLYTAAAVFIWQPLDVLALVNGPAFLLNSALICWPLIFILVGLVLFRPRLRLIEVVIVGALLIAAYAPVAAAGIAAFRVVEFFYIAILALTVLSTFALNTLAAAGRGTGAGRCGPSRACLLPLKSRLK
jgi:hypothetical protein